MQAQKSRPGAGTAYAAARPNDSPKDAILHRADKNARFRTTHQPDAGNRSPIDRMLHRLEKVKSTGPGKWQALCPAHDDKRPSLSIKEADDHKVLLKCWSGCGAAEIVNALGLSLADLFPGDRRSLKDHGTSPMRRPFDYRDALTGIAHEATVIRLIASAINSGQEMDVESLTRLAQAEERVVDALRIAGGVQ